MLDYLNRAPQLSFNFAMVELQVYQLNTGSGPLQLVMPLVTARTKEIIRAVV